MVKEVKEPAASATVAAASAGGLLATWGVGLRQLLHVSVFGQLASLWGAKGTSSGNSGLHGPHGGQPERLQTGRESQGDSDLSGSHGRHLSDDVDSTRDEVEENDGLYHIHVSLS